MEGNKKRANKEKENREKREGLFFRLFFIFPRKKNPSGKKEKGGKKTKLVHLSFLFFSFGVVGSGGGDGRSECVMQVCGVKREA